MTTQQDVTVHGKQEVGGEERTRPGRTYRPEVDICETREGLWLWADMPGVDEQSIEVNLDDDVLTIEGRVDLSEYSELEPLYTEYNVGNYVRRFTLSQAIDADRIKARMENGVLELELPKTERAKPRRIPVSAA